MFGVPLVSIIVPVYKTEQFLDRCLESICYQTYKNLEIILVDDGSPDKCPNMCDEWANKDSRIKVIHKDNEGLGLARNSGLQSASGQYVTFVDSDDWIECSHIENLCREIMDSGADAVIGTFTSVSANGHRQAHPLRLEQRVFYGEEVYNQIVLNLIGTDSNSVSDVGIESSSCMILYRHEIIQRYNLRFPSERVAVAEDLFFNIDFFMHARRVCTVNEFGYYYRENLQSISHRYDKKRFERTCRFYEQIWKYANAYELDTESRIERTFLMKIRVAIRMIVDSELSIVQKNVEIQSILNNVLVRDVLARYPIQTYPAGHKVLAYMMRYRCAVGVYCLFLLRESARNKSVFQRLMAQFGIGK